MTTFNEQGEAINPELGKLYYTVGKETLEPVRATIKGEVPSWINGSLFRNGPGKFELGDQQMNHIFDALSILHRFDIRDGEVTYQNRFQQSDAYVLGMKQNRVVLTEFGTVAYPDPCLNIFQRIMSRFVPAKGSDNYQVNWFQIGDEFFVCGEANAVRKIDPETLETLEKVKLPETLSLNSATAHPHTDQDGTLYNMGSTYGKNNLYNILKTPKSEVEGNSIKNMSTLAAIPASLHKLFPSYYHSFGMTENYFIFLEQPLLVNIFKLLKASFMNKPIRPALEYHPEMKAKFYLVRRDNGEILPIRYEADAFFSFHFINSYEEDGHVVVDMICFENADVLDKAYVKKFRDGVLPATDAKARRYVLPLDIQGKETEENLNGLSYSKAKSILQSDGRIHCIPDLICDQAIEAPQINYRLYNGKPYRYFYGIAGKDAETLIKSDAMTNSSMEWHEDSCFPSEPYFVSRPDPTAEDDGVILSAVVDVREGKDPFLLILDASNFQEIGRAMLPTEIPNGVHGIFVPRN